MELQLNSAERLDRSINGRCGGAAVQSILSSMTTPMPADSDVVGALESLARIQSTYGLAVRDLASGTIAGRPAVTPLGDRTVFDVAVQCLAGGRPDAAVRWLDHLRHSASSGTATVPPSSLYQALARAFAQVRAQHPAGATISTVLHVIMSRRRPILTGRFPCILFLLVCLSVCKYVSK